MCSRTDRQCPVPRALCPVTQILYPRPVPVVSSVTNWLCFYIICLTASDNMKSRTLYWASLIRSFLFGLMYCLLITRPLRGLLCVTRVHSSLISPPPPISFMFSCLIFYISHQSVWAFATPRLTFGCFERLYCQLLFCPMQSATQSLQPTLCLLFFCCCILITDAITITLAFYTLYFLCNSLISSFIIMHLILSFHLCVLIFIRFSPTIVLI